jgi:glucose-6-phosphate isomerase
MISCAISGCLEMVNPFNQDGVEEYKNIMHNLLNN